MKVIITGSRYGHRSVLYWMEQWVERRGIPELWVLGDASGVDMQARSACVLRGWPHHVERVVSGVTSPQRYHDRNQRMVDLCSAGDACLAFPREGSRGTFDCANRARKSGLTVYVAPITRQKGPNRRQEERMASSVIENGKNLC